MAVVLLGQIEGELVVDGQLVVTRAFTGIPVVMIRGITLFTVIPCQSLCAAVTLARLSIAVLRLSIALALFTLATIHWVPVIPCLALVTLTACGQVIARLLTGLPIFARTVSITLTLGTVGKVPSVHQTLHFLMWATITSGKAFTCRGDNYCIF